MNLITTNTTDEMTNDYMSQMTDFFCFWVVVYLAITSIYSTTNQNGKMYKQILIRTYNIYGYVPPIVR